MKEEIAKKWVKALRSGDYKQGTGRLRAGTEANPNYCCLGVLCDISGLGTWNNKSALQYKIRSSDCLYNRLLPEAVVAWAQLHSGKGSRQESESLYSLNDNGSSFDELAEIIEIEWKTL